MPPSGSCLFALAAAAGLAGCTSLAPMPGTPEFAAAEVSRAYDCGVRVDRRGIIARLPSEQRARFIAANARFAVKSYTAPRSCDAAERARLQRELRPSARL